MTKNRNKKQREAKKTGKTGGQKTQKKKRKKVIYNDKNRSCKATHVTSKGVHAHIHTHVAHTYWRFGGGNANKKWQLNYGQILSQRRGSFR